MLLQLRLEHLGRVLEILGLEEGQAQIEIQFRNRLVHRFGQRLRLTVVQDGLRIMLFAGLEQTHVGVRLSILRLELHHPLPRRLRLGKLGLLLQSQCLLHCRGNLRSRRLRAWRERRFGLLRRAKTGRQQQS